jgi:uncharacterized repeat protein (TIGR03806 family)
LRLNRLLRMKKYYLPALTAVFCILTLLYSCGGEDAPEDAYVPLPQSPVVLDLAAAPYANLSDYNFFEGALKDLTPVFGVLPYDLNSGLFADYAKKKRFVWMPAGQTATYVTDGKILDFPTGTVLIKNFYYDNVQPDNTTRILETRLMIKKSDGWVFANYIWNEAQTTATLNTSGGTQQITWLENGIEQMVNYHIPSQLECRQCHSQNAIALPLGTKPQNLNKNYSYAGGTQNQLDMWKSFGYLNTVPANILTTVDWTDEANPLEVRVRSYLDVNCAHCHTEGADCGHTPMNLAFSQSSLPANLGICREPVEFVTGTEQYVVDGQDVDNSLMYFRMSTKIQSEMMPPIGRTTLHTEALELMEQWINSIETPCP